MLNDEVIEYEAENQINETSLSLCSSVTESANDKLDYELYYLWRFKKRRKNITKQSWQNSGQFLSAVLIIFISFDGIIELHWGLCRWGIMFYIPYFIFNLFVICPIFMLDMAIGSISNYGLGRCFEVIPICIGLGWSMLCANLLFISSYATILITLFSYIIYTIKEDPPYWRCNNYYNTKNCVTKLVGNISHTSFAFYEFINLVLHLNLAPKENSLFAKVDYMKLTIIFLLLSVTYLLLLVHKRIITRIFKICIIFSGCYYVFLLFFIFQYKGSMEGLKMLVRMDLRNLFEFSMWFDAIYNSFSYRLIGYGAVITYSSYNLVSNDVIRDSVILIIFENAFSVIITIDFAILKSIGSKSLNIPSDCGDSSSYLIQYLLMIESFKNMRCGRFLVMLFVFTSILMTYPNYYAFVKSTYIAFTEIFSINRTSLKAKIFKAGVCIFCFLISIFYTQHNSAMLYSLFHMHALQMVVPILVLLETLVFTLLYGSNNLRNALLTTRKFSWAWIYIICIGVPIFLILFILTYLISHQPNFSSIGLFTLHGAISLILFPILLGVIIQFIIYRAEYVTLSMKNIFKKMLIPQDYWIAEKRSVKRWKK